MWSHPPALANDGGHSRHQARGDVGGLNDNEEANWKACQVALKCHIENVNHHITEGGLDGCNGYESYCVFKLGSTTSQQPKGHFT